MPQKAAHLRRSGDDARGSARINQTDALPNTRSAEWKEKFEGSSSTADAMGDENGSPNGSPAKPSRAEVAATMKRPLAAHEGSGHSQGNGRRYKR